MLYIETYENNRLRALHIRKMKIIYSYDRQLWVRKGKEAEFDAIEKEEDKLNEIKYSRSLFSGHPHEWLGNEKGGCWECPLESKCVVWNDWLNRPFKKHCYDQDGFEIHYDQGGNRNQIINLKTGEQV